MVTAYAVVLALVGLERLFELWLSRRHAAWSFDRGAVEFGHSHLRPMQMLHTGLLLGCLLEGILGVGGRAGLYRPLWPVWLGALLSAQALRYWAVWTLGRRWNVRVIVLPGLPAVRAGPYRWLRHPNYVAVVLEGLALPMLGGAWVTAILFAGLNAWMLLTRIRCEELALNTFCQKPGMHPTSGMGQLP